MNAKFLLFALVIMATCVEGSIFSNKYTAEFDHSVYLAYVLTGLGILLGLIAVFFGYRLFKPVLFVFGFIIFAGITYLVLWHYTDVGLIVIIVAPFIAGVIGGLVMLLVMKVGIFFIGAAAGFILFGYIMSVRGGGLIHEPYTVDVLLGVFPLVGGILALLFEKPLIIISTSFAGSYAVLAGIDRYVHGGFCQVIPLLVAHKKHLIFADYKTYIELGCCAALAAIGIFVQFKKTGKDVYHRHTRDKDGYYSLNY